MEFLQLRPQIITDLTDETDTALPRLITQLPGALRKLFCLLLIHFSFDLQPRLKNIFSREIFGAAIR